MNESDGGFARIGKKQFSICCLSLGADRVSCYRSQQKEEGSSRVDRSARKNNRMAMMTTKQSAVEGESIFIESHQLSNEPENSRAADAASMTRTTTERRSDEFHISLKKRKTKKKKKQQQQQQQKKKPLATKVCLSKFAPAPTTIRLKSPLLIFSLWLLLLLAATTFSSSSIYSSGGGYLRVVAAATGEQPLEQLSDRNQQHRPSSNFDEEEKEKISDIISEHSNDDHQDISKGQSSGGGAKQFNGIPTRRAIGEDFNNDEDDADDDDDVGLAPTKDTLLPDSSSSSRVKRSTTAAAADERRPFVDCKRLTSLWEYLAGTYPALGDYLYGLALGQSDRTSATASNRKSTLSQEFVQTVKLIGKLLSEADQLAREKSIATLQLTAAAVVEQSPVGSDLQQHPVTSGQLLSLTGSRPASAWLTRVRANPAYARIVHQHLLHLQRQQQQNRPLARHRPLDSLPSGEVSYGRVAHHPHEMDSSASSLSSSSSAGANTLSRTLDKLHLLNHHHRHHNSKLPPDSPASANDISADPSSSLDSSEESNQIPPIESEPDSKATNSEYVYGNVLLRPSQARAAGGLGSMDQGSQPIDKLRKYNRLHNGNNNNHQYRSPSSSTSTSSQLEKSISEAANAYGRVVIGPQQQQSSATSSSSDRHHKQQQQDQQQLSTTLDNKHQSQGPGSLNRLRDQLEPSQLGFGSLFSSSARVDAATDPDEMTAQQQAGSMAAVEPNGGSSGDNPQLVDDFEGLFHSGPLEHVEASRQVRRAHELTEGRVTTAKPGEILVID